ncbi:helix-turn-helix domain-containing protein [Calothrix sp. CCY 0018]|uniref:helix-turn-helix domain-containing protein n=1 Tax=Calothrix sp. CCY 0018 TaxID=3103864 RepID=UPI0039C6DA7F
MKAKYRYRVYSSALQKVALSQLFGCVRVVWNDALALCVDSYKSKSSIFCNLVYSNPKYCFQKT